MRYIYGMRNRPAGPGCQPDGFLEFKDDPSGRYHNILFYDHKLPLEEAYNYELDYLGKLASGDGVTIIRRAEEPPQDNAHSYRLSFVDHISDEEYTRLCDLFNTKFDLQAHSFGSQDITIDRRNGFIYLEGLPQSIQGDSTMVNAIGDYMDAIIRYAVATSRVNHRTAPVEGTSEKYQFRTWLNRIGLKGPEYKATRKVLLKNLEGSAAYAGKEQA